MDNVNTLMNLKDDGTSRYNDLGRELDREIGDALRDILNAAIEKNGAIDIAGNAVTEVSFEKLF